MGLRSEMKSIGLSRACVLGDELKHIAQAIETGRLSGNGTYTQRCQAALQSMIGGHVLLTHSGTAALEMAAILADLGPGDEVIMPSFTFVSTANAVVLRGAVPVFVDIRPDTLNIDEKLIEAAITPRTKAIFTVDYAGVGCDMDLIGAIAEKHGLTILEDAAQGFGAKWRDKPLGSFGHLAAFSFHDTKNIISGEGGALIVNDRRYKERAEIIWEKGTDRARFMRGQVDKYTWRDIGSSFLPSELIAAFLWGQLERAEEVTTRRLAQWRFYDEALAPVAQSGRIGRPSPPAYAAHNGHIYFATFDSSATRNRVADMLHAEGVGAVGHYVPLHSSPAGQRFGRAHGSLAVTDDLSERLLRLPLYHDMTEADQVRVVETLRAALTPEPA